MAAEGTALKKMPLDFYDAGQAAGADHIAYTALSVRGDRDSFHAGADGDSLLGRYHEGG